MASTGSVTLARRGLKAIETLTALDGRTPDASESEALAGWPGWGPLAPAFDTNPEGTWAQINDQLTDLLTAHELTLAGQAVDNSFYTPDLVVDAVYSLLREAGFTGGRILEPGCGSGTFMRRVPTDWDVDFTGVEKDPISARIAAALHPEATILKGRYEKLSPKSGFDAVVGNVPFSSSTVYDPASGLSENLHNYFVLRSLQLLREGGYLAVVTSRYAVDADDSIIRRASATADFVGALRLPTGTFHGEGTDVVADIIVLRKNTVRPRSGWTAPAAPVDEAGLYSAFAPQRSSSRYGSPYYGQKQDRSAKVHQYWADQSAHVAGTIEITGNFHNPIKVIASDIPASVEAARAALAQVVSKTPMFTHEHVLDVAGLEDADGRKEGSFHVIDGAMVRVDGGKLIPVKASKELHALVTLRDLTVRLLDAESDPHAPAESMTGIRIETLAAYQAYVAKFGPLNRGTLHEGPVDPDTGAPSQSWRRPTLGGFRRDPEYLKVMAIEHYDQATDTAEPAPILLRRVNAAPAPITKADSPAEALSITLGESGYADLSRIASLLGLPGQAAAVSALGPLVLPDPEDGGRHIPARDYLSGDVRAKLAAARTAAAKDRRYETNVTVLEDVLPADLGPHEIRMNLGNPCLTPEDIGEFLQEVVGNSGQVTHFAPTASWTCEAPYGLPPEASTTWGTSKMNAYELVHCALNGKAPVVYEEVYEQGRGTRKVRSAEQTIAAQEKLNEIHDKFSLWVWEDPDRTARLCAEYNPRFNSYVPRVSDGSHLTFPGMSEVMTPHPWQRDIVDRIVSSPAVLCGHSVGSGKTLSMALSVVTLKRFGLARKPLIIVPNHLLEQISREMQQAFPLGKFLIASKEDLTKDLRRLFAARCATGDWDAVVMTHQGFTSLPVHPDTEAGWIEGQKEEFEAHLRSEAGGYAGAKEIARKIRSLESRLEKVRDNQNTDPDQVIFEHLGIDYIGVDEAHYMKRLPVASRAEGFSMGASKRATDLLMKAETIRDRKPGKPYLGLFTGTPWTNSLAETFVWQKFLQPEALAKAGVSDFDAWAAVFVKRETVVEVAPDGSGFRTATRPTRMMNLPELKTMLHAVADILTADDLGLERPQKELHSISVQPAAGQSVYVAQLVERAEKLRTGAAKPGTNDNMLAICGEGRRVALDPRLVGVEEESPKVDALATEVAGKHRALACTTYGASTVPGALQVVFCDQGTPNKDKGAQTYGRVRDALIARGVPAKAIRMIHEAKDDKSRAALFAACRDGSVNVLLGSTEKMGTGVNIQTRLAAVHHLDAPWRPSDMEQRDGRADRPHNLNDSVDYYRYVTERTFDAYMWQALERKAIGFAAMYDRNSSLREIEDIGGIDLAPDYSEMKALASGNPLLLEQATVAATVKKLRTLRAVDAQSMVAARKRINAMRRELDEVRTKLTTLAELSISDERTHEPHGLFAAMVRDSRTSGYHRYARDWRGLQLKLTGEKSTLRLEFRHKYRTLDSVSVAKSGVIYKGRAERAEAMLRDLAIQWEEKIPEFTAGLQDRLDDLEAGITRAQGIVDGYRFSREGELRAAEDRLTEIDAELTAEAGVLEEVAA